MNPARHLPWIPAVDAFGLLAPFLVSDLLRLPVDHYYLV